MDMSTNLPTLHKGPVTARRPTPPPESPANKRSSLSSQVSVLDSKNSTLKTTPHPPKDAPGWKSRKLTKRQQLEETIKLDAADPKKMKELEHRVGQHKEKMKQKVESMGHNYVRENQSQIRNLNDTLNERTKVGKEKGELAQERRRQKLQEEARRKEEEYKAARERREEASERRTVGETDKLVRQWCSIIVLAQGGSHLEQCLFQHNRQQHNKFIFNRVKRKIELMMPYWLQQRRERKKWSKLHILKAFLLWFGRSRLIVRHFATERMLSLLKAIHSATKVVVHLKLYVMHIIKCQKLAKCHLRRRQDQLNFLVKQWNKWEPTVLENIRNCNSQSPTASPRSKTAGGGGLSGGGGSSSGLTKSHSILNSSGIGLSSPRNIPQKSSPRNRNNNTGKHPSASKDTPTPTNKNNNKATKLHITLQPNPIVQDDNVSTTTNYDDLTDYPSFGSYSESCPEHVKRCILLEDLRDRTKRHRRSVKFFYKMLAEKRKAQPTTVEEEEEAPPPIGASLMRADSIVNDGVLIRQPTFCNVLTDNEIIRIIEEYHNNKPVYLTRYKKVSFNDNNYVDNNIGDVNSSTTEDLACSRTYSTNSLDTHPSMTARIGVDKKLLKNMFGSPPASPFHATKRNLQGGYYTSLIVERSLADAGFV